ncbi:hypothetical protein BpHYR1_020560 [Brachionus plicatilis]|uniref:Uncharacterized protein n=1 Tax=Brachionus plicatilis TaxID=10195 RepID=A0A3M7S8A5_BRAPC|nr:hypothetical protein BpHYR1_020560 [Brachionus plicatilis]
MFVQKKECKFSNLYTTNCPGQRHLLKIFHPDSLSGLFNLGLLSSYKQNWVLFQISARLARLNIYFCSELSRCYSPYLSIGRKLLSAIFNRKDGRRDQLYHSVLEFEK